MVDFSKLLEELDDEKLIFPKDIFYGNPRSDKYDHLRGDQQEILATWFGKRSEKDTILKMNTGAGKTVVGLLQLQSSINEDVGPALYLCLDNHLVSQVLKEAEGIGIKCVTFEEGNDIPVDFLNNKAILVTTFQKLFNAKTVFGTLGNVNKPVVQIGSIVVDDAHSAISKAREVFTLSFPCTHSIYNDLVGMFAESLKSQYLGTATDIMEGRDRFGIIMVPYWAWSERIQDVTRLLSTISHEDDELKFKWSIVRDFLEHYYVLVSASKIEITPKCLPIQNIPSFHKAKRRIFMSATLNDDSALIRDMQVSKKAVTNPLFTNISSDVRERMILAPYNLDKSLNTENLVNLLKGVQKFNVVSLVGSDKRAGLWEKNDFIRPKSSSIKRVIEKLGESTGNHVVLSNRYDGVDLPGDMCRILVIDGLPSSNTLFEQFSLFARPGSRLLRMAQAQKIEQGMGRGVRSVSDYCVILLSGADLVAFVSSNEFHDLMSAQTVAQLKLGNTIVELVKKENEDPVKILGNTMSKLLSRDQQWITLHNKHLSKVHRPTLYNVLIDYAEAEREAFDYACSGQYLHSAETINKAISEVKELEPEDKGWYMQLAASYLYPANRTRAMELQLSAHRENTYLLRPPTGTRYLKLTNKETIQAIRLREFINKFQEPNGIILFVNNILEQLTFAPGTSSSFERALKELGNCLGYESQQPEKEFGVGSDGLWNLYDDHFLILEAKNEVELTRKEIYKSEVEQLSNSYNWFNEEYAGKNGIPVLIHPCNKTHREAYAPANAMVLQPEELERLRNNIRGLFVCLCGKRLSEWSTVELNNEIRNYHLDRKSLTSYLKPIE